MWLCAPYIKIIDLQKCKLRIDLLIAVMSLLKICTVISVIDGLLRLAVTSTVPLLSLTRYIVWTKLIVMAMKTRRYQQAYWPWKTYSHHLL